MPLMVISMGMTACSGTKQAVSSKFTESEVKIIPVVYEKRSPKLEKSQKYGSFTNKLSGAALGRLSSKVTYNGSYVKIAYPWGDVPSNIGVCTDVVIRSYRKLGIDLQQQVHQDMSAAFNAYPNPRKWGLSRPDTNIDHRRVYNLRAFFARRGAGLPITNNPTDYRPGDLVTWMVGPDLPHIGVVVDKPSRADPKRKMIVHNIANGPQMEDILFRFPISGHYRYTPDKMGSVPTTSYASRVKSKKGSMDYAQLVAAAKLLADIPVTKVRVRNTKDTTAKVGKTNSLQVAILNKASIKTLLNK